MKMFSKNCYKLIYLSVYYIEVLFQQIPEKKTKSSHEWIYGSFHSSIMNQHDQTHKCRIPLTKKKYQLKKYVLGYEDYQWKMPLEHIIVIQIMFQDGNSSSSESLNTIFHEEEPILQDKTIATFKDGHWNQHQIFKFISYLIYNRQTLKLKLQRRTNKVFKQMSDFIATRTSVQCRSQNQRLFRKFKNFRTIISTFKEQYGREKFENDFLEISKNPAIRFRTELEKLTEKQDKTTSEKSTQTDQLHLSEPIIPRFPEFQNYCNWRQSIWNPMQNIMVLPFYS